jgi:hypothetical protein
MSDALLRDLPRDLPSFLKRFGTDAKCRAYLVWARWPEGFRCAGCGHREAWSHKKRLIEECRSCVSGVLRPPIQARRDRGVC